MSELRHALLLTCSDTKSNRSQWLRGVGECNMHDYDILVFNEAGALSLSIVGTYPGEAAAIRTAKRFCRTREKVEVWGPVGRIFAFGGKVTDWRNGASQYSRQGMSTAPTNVVGKRTSVQ